MFRTRKQILAFLREKCGYTGADDRASVDAFIKDEGIEIEGDFEGAWKRLDLKTVRISVSADAGEDVQVSDDSAPADAEGAAVEDEMPEEEQAKSARLKPKAKPSIGPQGRKLAGVEFAMSGKGSSIGAAAVARKSYNARAQQGKTAFVDADVAEAWGAWFRLGLAEYGPAEVRNYAQKSNDLAIVRKASSTVQNALGAALIPEDFLPNLIELREEYGVGPRLIGTTPMSSDTLTLPRNTGDATVFWTGESTAATESDGSFDNVKLTANKLLGLNRHPSEILNDSALSIADITARSFAREAARKIDEAIFNGDGTSTYGGFVGIANTFRKRVEDAGGTWGTNTDYAAGLVVASGNTFAEFTTPDFNKLVGILPTYADSPSAKFVMHKSLYGSIIERLGRAVGGITYSEALGSRPLYTLFGYQVEFSQVMPKIDANSQVAILFGDFSQGCKFGEVRNSMSIDTSDQRYFVEDQIAIRFRQRVGILVHDIGNASATATSREAGPIVGLVSANS